MLHFLSVVAHLAFIAFSSSFSAIKLALFPDISIIACGKVPSILGKHYAKGCENEDGKVIKSLITSFSLLLLLLSRWMDAGDVGRPQLRLSPWVHVWGGAAPALRSRN